MPAVTIPDKLKGCLAAGAIGDVIGSQYEGQKEVSDVDFSIPGNWTDDTQLTIATCESIIEEGRVSPERIAQKFLQWYNARKLTGLGSSTLKALRDLQAGAHWALSGRSGEYAAGNGAAMRIAPLAFFTSIETDRTLIRDVCNITHKNDEAYVGCLAVLTALHLIITDQWTDQSLLALITPRLPDTLTRDNLLLLQENPSLSLEAAADLIGCSGHVVESVPFALFAAQKIREQELTDIIAGIIRCGGDTDTNASIAGQVMGTFTGYSGLSAQAHSTFRQIEKNAYISQIADELSKLL